MLQKLVQSGFAHILLFAFALIGIPLLIMFLSIENLFKGIPHKSDAEMIATFQTHKAEFETLLQMIKEDKGLKRVDDTWTDPEKPETIGVSPARIEEYKRLFKIIKTPRGFNAYQPDAGIEFIASSQGLGVSGSSKSYLFWTKDIPINVVESIDAYDEQEFIPTEKIQRKYPVFKPIEGNWYLIFEAD